MATEITMPKLSDTMTEGLFASWRKSVGDRIERGEIIAEIETDKAVMELEAFSSGVLIQTMVQGGEQVTVGTVLGLIGSEDELSAAEKHGQSPAVRAKSVTAAVEEISSREAPPSSAPTEMAAIPVSNSVKASPLVRRLARQDGIDLGHITGSGPDGRITQNDLTAFAGNEREIEIVPTGEPQTVIETQTAEQPPVAGPLRQAIAETVTRSWQSIPHFSVVIEIDMDACSEVVAELKDRSPSVGYNALVTKACAVALEKFPLLRSGTDGPVDDINIAFAVSVPNGLLMPVLRGCRRLTVAEIQAEASRLADKSRSGKLVFEEMSGAAFSLSNLGKYGVDEFTALIVPGQVAILAVGAVRERPVARNGRIEAAQTVRVTLSCDHRVVDGAYAASFLAELRTILEKPVALLV